MTVSCKVEKLKTRYPTPPTDNSSILGDPFFRPYESLTIQRPMMHFGRGLGLEVGIPGAPNREFLTQLFTGSLSHAAMLRNILGATNYRNFENLVRGKSQSSETTLRVLKDILKVDQNYIKGFAHGKKHGPLLPEFLDTLQLIEGLLSTIYNKVTDGFVPCRHCGENLLDKNVAFWSNTPHVGMNEAEYRFVDRILEAVIGWKLLQVQPIDPTSPASECSRETQIGLLSLVHPAQYPVGNWLQLVRNGYGCTNFLDLEKRLAGGPDSKKPISSHKFNKWACGEDLIPIEQGIYLTRNLKNPVQFIYGLFEARAFAFIQEFVTSAYVGEASPKRIDVRTLVFNRTQGLVSRLLVKLTSVGLTRKSEHSHDNSASVSR